MKHSLRLLLPLAVCAIAWTAAPNARQAQTPPEPRMINQSTDPLLAPFRFRSIGPASMGGRIDDIAVSDTDPNIIYVGYAVGGVFKSENNGTTWQPVFDEYPTASIGDIAIHPTNPNIVYVGTGEANNRQTSSFGDGIYKTTDGGKTFQNVGLKETQTIARIVIDPRNPETVYVAVPGHLFGPNKERGVYKTTDGGRSWNNVKFIDENTGFTDIAMDPANSHILYAASYQRRRMGCCFNGGGPGSALWKTTDGGKTWTKLTGRPAARHLRTHRARRVALQSERRLRPDRGGPGRPAVDDRRERSGRGDREHAGRRRQRSPEPRRQRRSPARSPRRPDAGRDRRRQQRARQAAAARPEVAAAAAAAATTGATTRDRIAASDAARRPDRRRRRRRSMPDAAASSARTTRAAAGPTSATATRGRCTSARCASIPTNDKTVYVAGLPVAKSLDGGRTFATLDDAGGTGAPGHVDQHAIWIDPKNPRHLIVGNDGGLNISWDQGRPGTS